jgi:hypothetical protein
MKISKTFILILLGVCVAILIFLMSKGSTFYEIVIRGDETCQFKTSQALDLLKSKSFKDYEYVKENIGIIECAERGSGMYVWEKPPRFVAGRMTYENNSTNLYASAIVHDACHVVQFKQGRSFNGEEAERECLDIQYSSLKMIGGTMEELEAVRSAFEKRYWEIPYKDRNW